jgi:hypothetical protein
MVMGGEVEVSSHSVLSSRKANYESWCVRGAWGGVGLGSQVVARDYLQDYGEHEHSPQLRLLHSNKASLSHI